MKGIIVFFVAMLGCLKMAESCSCLFRTTKEIMCASDFVGMIYVIGDVVESKKGPYQRVIVIYAIKGSLDVGRVYLSTRRPGEPINSCERYPLTKYEAYLLTATPYNAGGNKRIRAVLLYGCDAIIGWQYVATNEELLSDLDAISTDEILACAEFREEPVSVEVDRSTLDNTS